MNIVTEPHIAGKPITDKPRARPVRMVRWFIIVAVLMSAVIGAAVYFDYWRAGFIKTILSKPRPPTPVSIATAKVEVIPNLLTAVGDLAAVHQVNVTSDVSGRITNIMFEPGSTVKAGSPLVQLFDEPEQGDLASFKAQAVMGQLALDRAKQLAARQFGPQATVDQAQSTFDQVNSGIAKTEAIISQKLVKAPFDGVLGVRHVEVGQFLTAGTQIVSLTDLSTLYANFTVTEKDSGQLKVGQAVRIVVDAYPNRNFRRQDHHHRAADRDRHAQHPRAGDARQPRSHPQARHVHDRDGGAAGQAAGDHGSRDRGRLHAIRRFRLPAYREERGRRQDQPDGGAHFRAGRQPDRRPG